MTVEKNIESERTVTILTTKAHGYLAIEIYGKTALVKDKMDYINSIIDTIAFSKNKHDYTKDVAKEIDPEEEKEAIENLEKLLNLKSLLSGESITSGDF